MQLSKLRSGTRKLAGVSIPRQDRTSGAFKKASAAAGHAPDAGIADGSSSARARTDRPGRAKGGRVCREDGGSTISDASKRDAQKLEKEADHSRTNRNVMGGVTGALGVLGSVGNKLQRSGNKPAAILTGLGAIGSHFTAKDKDAQAKRIREGKAEDGEEDRKSGGAVKKGKC